MNVKAEPLVKINVREADRHALKGLAWKRTESMADAFHAALELLEIATDSQSEAFWKEYEKESGPST